MSIVSLNLKSLYRAYRYIIKQVAKPENIGPALVAIGTLAGFASWLIQSPSRKVRFAPGTRFTPSSPLRESQPRIASQLPDKVWITHSIKGECEVTVVSQKKDHVVIRFPNETVDVPVRPDEFFSWEPEDV